MQISPRSFGVAVVAAVAIATVTGGAATAAPQASAMQPSLHVARTLPGHYVAPLQIAVRGKHVYVADAGASALYEVGHSKPIAHGPAPSKNPENSGDLAGVAVAGASIAYTTTSADHKDTHLVVLRHGKKVLDANLARYELKHNPDGDVHYGATRGSKVSAQCTAELGAAHAPVRYRGTVDSHPYAVTSLGHGAWAVADAGGNDVLKVDGRGHISTIAVLPSQPLLITTALATQLAAPHCAGITYRFEAVPTDVEVGRHALYVTTLPGGAGGSGSVYRIARWGHPQRIATGFAEATNLAIGPHGVPVVVELGVGLFVPGAKGPKQIAALPGAAAVEWANGHFYASTAPAATGGSGPGHVVVLH